MPLSKTELLKAGRSAKIVEVEVPDLGAVCIRPMSGKDRDELMREMAGMESAYAVQNFSARVAGAVLCEPDGARMFGRGDIDKVSELPAPALDAIVKEGLRISGMNGKVEAEAEGNSDATPSDASS